MKYSSARSRVFRLEWLAIAPLCLLSLAVSSPASAAEISATTTESATTSSDPVDAHDVARQIDELIEAELDANGTTPAALTNDEDFLRRAYFDLTGTVPSAADVIRFGLTPSDDKRAEMIEQLLTKKEYAQNWARYWRDVIYTRATEARSVRHQPVFVKWMAEQLAANKSWDTIATEILTATGRMSEEGSAGLMFAHNANGEEVAAEASRIFMGIQIQCAQCHDHFTDQWTRVQFHELAAFFPRVRVQRVADSQPRDFEVVSREVRTGKGNNRLQQFFESLNDPEAFIAKYDTNADEILEMNELKPNQQKGAFKRLLTRIDKNKDQQITIGELKMFKIPNQARRGNGEHFMPDLNDPSAQGTRMSPVFFLSESSIEDGLPDIERRSQAADFITSSENVWFARAYVNRIWTVLLGEGFYQTIDDLGPEREVYHPEVLDLLAHEFIASGYDTQWLFRAIMNTKAYQRQSAELDPSQTSPEFASVVPTRLRADQIFNALVCALDVEDDYAANPRRKGKGNRGRENGSRGQFEKLFQFDPSEDSTDIAGTIPQALFLMNSSRVNNMIENRSSFVKELLAQELSTAATTSQVYLQVLGREPDETELELVSKYVEESATALEAYEDLVWSLINSTEFLTKR